jgi:hypothetical protein
LLDQDFQPFSYEAGTWGPAQANALPADDGGWIDPAQ